jgi:hypothetical protein
VVRTLGSHPSNRGSTPLGITIQEAMWASFFIYMEQLSNSEAEPLPLDWTEPFEWQAPDSWEAAENLQSLSVEMFNDGRIEAGLRLLENRRSAKEHYDWEAAFHTPPAAEHYRHTYLWDSGFFIMIYSQAALYCEQAGLYLESRLHELQDEETKLSIWRSIIELHELSRQFSRAGEEESFWLFEGQRQDGFLANVQYAPSFRWYEVEKALSLAKPKRTSNYTQPPVLPLAGLAQYKAMKRNADPKAELYAKDMYRRLEGFIGYFISQRRNSQEDALLGVIDPHETGMDSLRQWDYIKPFRRPRHPEMTQDEADRNMIADGAHFVDRVFKRRLLARGNLAKERELFWANDVSFNAIYFHNLQVMVRLAEAQGLNEEAAEYKRLSEEVEQAMIAKMWRAESDNVPKPGFYSLDADGEPIPTITISNLFGLILPNISERQLEAVLDMMDEDFDAPYPLPSDSINSPEFDPRNQEKDRLWRGPTWINTNFYLVLFGLRMQAERQDIHPGLRERCLAWSSQITEKSNQVIDMNASGETGPQGSGAYEHYDPITGEGQRPKVVNFGWTWLARLMKTNT